MENVLGADYQRWGGGGVKITQIQHKALRKYRLLCKKIAKDSSFCGLAVL